MADGTTPDTLAADFAAKAMTAAGRYGCLFEPVKSPSDDALAKLAHAMTLANDVATEGPNRHESGIPAAYTYFGQLVAHDLSFDQATLHPECPAHADPKNDRTPFLDLDDVYGGGPQAQPALFQPDGVRFVLGRDFGNNDMSRVKPSRASDLPRQGQCAQIADSRNDAHRIIAQLHDIFMRFHNQVVEAMPSGSSFAVAQCEARLHYQWVILKDFLPKIVDKPVLDSMLDLAGKAPRLSPNFRTPFKNGQPFMPREFCAAAFRFGHAMVRAGYRLNGVIDSAFPILGPDRATSLAGLGISPRAWGIDWDLFIDLSGQMRSWAGRDRIQLAHQINTMLVSPLGALPPPMAPTPAYANLALRDLSRGRGLGVPSGQAAARALGFEPLRDEQIKIGPDAKAITDVDASLAGNCPLWVYVLAEAVPEQTTIKTTNGDQPLTTRKLGPVGGSIVVSTILGLLKLDPTSLVNNPEWEPRFRTNGEFGLAELIGKALAFQ